MRFRMRSVLLSAALLLGGPVAFAQFVTYGDDPGRLQWQQVKTAHFRLVSPVGADSLARTYGALLERYQPVVGASVGMAPGQYHGGPLPVVLHTHHLYANGAVTWAPKRMDLYPVQDPYASDPTPWPLQLAVHESRHVAQMQFGYRKPLRFGQYLAGEMWHGLLDGLFVDPSVFEGDAVVAETALTASGRARTADFLNYYLPAFDRGDWRDWYSWRYGSFKRAAPDYYTTGFMTMAGMRVFYDKPTFSEDFFNDILRRPVPFRNLQRAMQRVSGKSFARTWRDIQEGFHAVWQEEAAARAPFTDAEQITETPDFETNYAGLAFLDGALYLLKDGKTTARRLIRRDLRPGSGAGETDCGPFARYTGELRADPVRHRLYWSEAVDDLRWEMGGSSRIRWQGEDGVRHDLTTESRFYNPAPAPDGSAVAAVEYPADGGSRLVVLRADDGKVLSDWPAPGGVQLTEPAWLGSDLYALGIAEGGFGIWKRVQDTTGRYRGWTPILPPTIQKMKQFRTIGSRLAYVSDRNGVNELYALDPESGRLERMTSTRYGGEDFTFAGDSLYFTGLGANGRMLYRCAARDLRPESVDPLQVHAWKIADALSAQENALLAARGAVPDTTAALPEATPYRKVLHLLRPHSWLPLYFNYDAVESLSFDLTYHTVSLGATGFFQNDLGTSTAIFAYSAHPDPYAQEHWRHAFHGKFTYSGLFPVFEASLDVNDRAAVRYLRHQDSDAEKKTAGFLTDTPAVSGSLRAYVPLRFNKDGWLRGLIPQVRWTFGNDVYNTGTVFFDTSRPFGLPRPAAFLGVEPGRNVPQHTVTASIRGYTLLPTASSQVYPRRGIGAEAGLLVRPGLASLFSPGVYAYLYGYLPGFRPEQGLRLSAIARQQLDPDAEIPYLSVVTYPRGFTGNQALQAYGNAPFQVKATADYAVPLYFGDISVLSPFVYIRNFLLIPHVDLACFAGRNDPDSGGRSAGTLVSAGFDLTVECGNLLWLPFDSSVGLTFDLLGGSAFKASGATCCTYIGALFSVDI